MIIISIKYNYPMSSPKTVEFTNILMPCIYMTDRDPKNYTLYINGREYPWPNANDFRYVVLENHLNKCIELDEAFYD